MKLPWLGQHPRRPQPEDHTYEQERVEFERDIGQIKRLNEYLLNRAVAEGRITEEAAGAIRATQSYAHEVMEIGPDSLR